MSTSVAYRYRSSIRKLQLSPYENCTGEEAGMHRDDLMKPD